MELDMKENSSEKGMTATDGKFMLHEKGIRDIAHNEPTQWISGY